MTKNLKINKLILEQTTSTSFLSFLMIIKIVYVYFIAIKNDGKEFKNK